MSTAEKPYFKNFQDTVLPIQMFTGTICHKRNAMIFGHGMMKVRQNIHFLFFTAYLVFIINLLILLKRAGLTPQQEIIAEPVACQNISAYRANIKI